MISDQDIQNSKTASGFNIAAAIWLILSPYILGFAGSTAAMVNTMVIGLAVGIAALIRLNRPVESSWLAWANVIMGAWLIVAPFLLGFASLMTTWNSLILGAIVITLSSIGLSAVHHEPKHLAR